MNEKDLSPEEGLELIQTMILKARKQFTDNSFYFLLWGGIVGFASLTHFYLQEYTSYEKPWIAWLLTFAGGIISAIRGYREGKKQTAKRETDIVYAWLWASLGIAMFIVAFNQEIINHQVVPITLLMAGVGTATSGAMMRFWPLQAGAAFFWIMAIVAFQQEIATQMLIMAISVAIGYLVPGFMMKRNFKRNAI